MSDITKCTGYGCPFMSKCWRVQAPGGQYQAYFRTPPIKDGKCEYLWLIDANEDMNSYA